MKHFTLAELCRSHTADRHGIDNRCKKEEADRLTALVEHVLDPAREAWGGPLTVNSGYRSPQLNRQVGGVPASQHMRGEAADITAGSRADNRRLFEQMKALDYDQLIWEKGDATGPDWIHVSYVEGKNRHKILTL